VRTLHSRRSCRLLLRGDLLLLAATSQPFVGPWHREVTLELLAWHLPSWVAARAEHVWRLP
jgi:hypothetical protein